MLTSPPPAARRVLVVDDSDALRGVVCAGLRRSGFAVIDAVSAESALMMAASHTIDAVLTDVEMTGMSGIELCGKLGKLDAVLGRKVPVWIMTGSPSPDIEAKANAAGARAVFRKPFNATSLAEALKRELHSEI